MPSNMHQKRWRTELNKREMGVLEKCSKSEYKNIEVPRKAKVLPDYQNYLYIKLLCLSAPYPASRAYTSTY